VQPCDQDVLAGALAGHPARMARDRRPVTAEPAGAAVAPVTPRRGAGRSLVACATLEGVSALLFSRLHVDLQRTNSAVCSPAR
jgi:hypothetical protein